MTQVSLTDEFALSSNPAHADLGRFPSNLWKGYVFPPEPAKFPPAIMLAII